MELSIIDFGKHSGKSLLQIILKDADWFFMRMKIIISRTPTRRIRKIRNYAAWIDCSRAWRQHDTAANRDIDG
jgi:hypothetical protein